VSNAAPSADAPPPASSSPTIPSTNPLSPVTSATNTSSAAITGTVTLSEAESRRLLARYSVAVSPFVTARSADDAVSAVDAEPDVAFPVAAKLCGRAIAHKTERGLVRLGIADEQALRAACEELLAAARAADGEVELLVTSMVQAKRELMAGVIDDPSFGPTIMVGFGGILAEAVNDVAFRLLPLSAADAAEMVDGLATSALLGEFRGEPAVDRSEVADVLMALGRIAQEVPGIRSLDVNPLMLADGKPVAVDALVEIDEAAVALLGDLPVTTDSKTDDRIGASLDETAAVPGSESSPGLQTEEASSRSLSAENARDSASEDDDETEGARPTAPQARAAQPEEQARETGLGEAHAGQPHEGALAEGSRGDAGAAVVGAHHEAAAAHPEAARARHEERLDLAPLFEPKGIVVTGVSSHPGKFGFVTLHNLLACGYQGPVFAVGRSDGEVLGVPVVGSVADVPHGAADLVFMCTPAEVNETVLQQAADAGLRAAYCAAGGYGEAGEQGQAAQQRLLELSRRLGIVLAGPNGQGVVSTPAQMCAQIVAPYPPPGRIAIASQSGNLMSSLMNLAAHNGVGVSRALAVGNAAGLGIGDCLEYFADDHETAVSVVYVESVPDGRALFERLRPLAQRKPIVVVKGGASEAGERAAKSHTGALAADDVIFDGMCRQAGVVRACDIEEAFETAAAFAGSPLPKGDRTVVVTTAGGWGVAAMDAMADTRLVPVELPGDLRAAIDAKLPPRWSRANPVDMAGGETRDTIPEILDLVASHREVDAVVLLGIGVQSATAAMMRRGGYYPEHGLGRIVDFHERQDARYADAVVRISAETATPILAASELATAAADNPAPATLRAARTMCYSSAGRAIRALNHLADHAAWRRARGLPLH